MVPMSLIRSTVVVKVGIRMKIDKTKMYSIDITGDWLELILNSLSLIVLLVGLRWVGWNH